MELTCPRCGEAVPIEHIWAQLGDTVQCPACGAESQIEHDLSYDRESGEEFYSFWLESL